MDQREKRQIGEQVEPGGRPKAPGCLELLQRFINTWNHDLPAEWDRLATPSKARTWLRQKQLITAKSSVTAVDAARLRAIREALRSLVVANLTRTVDQTSIDLLRTASVRAGLVITIDDTGHTQLQPAQADVDGAIATLLGILHEAQVAGSWPRLKGCRQCSYAFFDFSKNRSASWCSMSICGNRNKNRDYYHRHRMPG